MRRHQKIAINVLPLLILGCICVGCRTPEWCAYRSLRCVPSTADASGRTYWDNCSAGQIPVVSPNEIDSQKTNEAIQGQESKRGAHATKSTDAIIAAVPIQLAAFSQSAVVNDKSKQQDPLRLPAEFPGAETPPISLPRLKADGTKLDTKTQQENILKLFPELPPLPYEADALPDDSRAAMGLEEFHRIARENHPGLRAAAANVEVAHGAIIQAGLPPNPNFGYEADTVRTANTPGYKGVYLQQTFITAQKLGLAAEAATVDYANAVVSQQKTWITVQASVRRAYFQLLAARRRAVLARVQCEYSERAYEAQIKLVIAGESAPYEPLQLRVLTTQARASLIRAQQDAIAAWRTLAATVAVPALEPTNIEGRIDCPAPDISYESAVTRMTAVHTDLRIAENLISKNRTLVTLADRTPIPNLDVGFVLQQDYTFKPGGSTYNLTLGGAVPVWNQNQGNRISARAELVRSAQLVTDTENQLIAKLAATYSVYKSNRQLASSFRTDALSDQVRAYRGIYQRYLTDPSGISFNDVIVAQQTVSGVLNQYLDILQAQWQSTVDLGELLQVDDVFQMGDAVPVAEIPNF